MDKKRLQLAIQALSPSSALLPVYGEGSRTTTDYRKEGTLILKPLLENLVYNQATFVSPPSFRSPAPGFAVFLPSVEVKGGAVACWGCQTVSSELDALKKLQLRVQRVVATDFAFAALLEDGVRNLWCSLLGC